MSPTDFRTREIPFSQLPHLSHAAESGDVARGLGYLPSRSHQTPQAFALNPSSVRRVHPLPSAAHPWPPTPPTAA